MTNETNVVWFPERHHRRFSAHQLDSVIEALEAIAPAAQGLHQARKIGVEVVVPREIEEAYILRHGEDGQRIIDLFIETQVYEGDEGFGNLELFVAGAVQALEEIAPAASALFQARKLGLEVLFPDSVERAYVHKHGEAGQKVVNFLNGAVSL